MQGMTDGMVDPDGSLDRTIASARPGPGIQCHSAPSSRDELRLCLNMGYAPQMSDPTTFVDALDRAGYRLTEPRRSLAGLIADHEGHFTAAELVTEARARRLGVGRATVFRTLEVLEELGAIERLDLPSGEHAYVGCEPVHHHHVVCSRCGRTSEIDDTGLRGVVRDIARQTGFRVDDHRLELFGVCADCLAAGAEVD